MRKDIIRTTENQLHRMIKESVREVLNEVGDTNYGQWILGRLSKRQHMRGDADKSAETRCYAWEQNGEKYSPYFSQGEDMEQYNGDNERLKKHIHNIFRKNKKNMDENEQIKITDKLIKEAFSRSIKNLLREREENNILPSSDEVTNIIIQSITNSSNDCYLDIIDNVENITYEKNNVVIEVSDTNECRLYTYYYDEQTETEYEMSFTLYYVHFSNPQIFDVKIEGLGDVELTLEQSKQITNYIQIVPSQDLSDTINDEQMSPSDSDWELDR